MKFHLYLTFLLALLSCSLFSQNRRLRVVGAERIDLKYEEIIKDSIQARNEAKSIITQLHSLSYLAASIDSITYLEKDISIYISTGKTYQWAKLSSGNLSEEEVQKVDLNGRLFLKRPFNSKQLQSLFERTIRYFENKGYPFASIRLDSVRIDSNNGLRASLLLKKNKFYSIDSIEIKGKSGVNREYLLNHLELEPGSPYNEKVINNISTRINEIPFISESKRKEVRFFDSYVKVILHLEKKKASRFDGVLGLLTNEDDGSIELTGDVDLNLINAFNRGENIGLNWRKLKGNSQDLQIEFSYPYFLNSPFGIEANFKLFKRDTTFIDLISRLGINYSISRGEFIRIFVENKTSNLLSTNRFLNQANSQLPPFGNIRVNLFGVGYQIRRFNYKYNPSRGIGLESSFAVGRKRLQKIVALEEEQPDIYDDISLNTTQYNGELKVQYFIPLASRSTVLLGNQSATTYSENLYQNELLRIGGLKILRGFDEESINVSTYSIFTLEYRFLLDRNSFFSIFSDGGYYESNSISDYTSDTPFGIGAGISFETNAGIFTFNYAVGKQFDNPIDLRAAKIHFGFINFF